MTLDELQDLISRMYSRKEFADVLAWLATIANVAGINLTEAVRLKYGHGCPGCNQMICVCADSEKP
jgi:NTP pyrophosphatase (non-canonical NTP hydrolase)